MKKNTVSMLVCLCSLFFLPVSCTKEPGTPKSLEEILKRNEVDGTVNNGSGGNTGGSSGQVTYQGVYASTVKSLLSKVSGWRTASCLTCNDGVPPNVPVGNNCMRDIYVAAAVNYAWAAESYARLNNNAQAASMATLMNQSLQSAKNLCSSSIGVGGASCQTFYIYPC